MMPKLAPASVAMVFNDLPYGVTSAAWDRRFDLQLFWKNILQVVGSRWVALFTATQPFASAVILSQLKCFKHDLIWSKKKSSGLHSTMMPLRSHEHVLVFAPHIYTYTPQMTAGKSYAHSGSNYQSLWHGKAMVKKAARGRGKLRFPKSVLSCDEQDLRTDTLHGHRPTRFHPTQKPLALLEWLIATYTNPGDTVLDPCFGSNTTGVACARLGRNYIGIEKDATYFAAGKARMEAEHERLRSALL